MNPFLDKQFLKQLDEDRNKVIYAKVVALTLEEYPTQEISGIVQTGSINIDSKSAVRRTCSLTLISTLKNIDQIDVDLSDYYWGLNTKFKLYIGVENNINAAYDKIIWFDQGIFLITTFSSTLNTNNFSISISGKDKMCLLNGDVGGVIPAEHCFGVLEEYNEETDQYDSIDLPLKEIIKEAVHTYGNEAYHNILINDLDDTGKELLEYQGKDGIFLISYHEDNNSTYLELQEGNKQCYIKTNGQYQPTRIQYLSYYDNLNSSFDSGIEADEPTRFWYSNNNINENKYYTALKIPYGMVAGYRETDLTYPDAEKLIIKAGETVVTLLDKITSVFTDYEYFYNTSGQFVFQKKKTYLNTSFNNLQKDYETGEVYGTSAANTSAVTYSFEDGNLITAYTNTPNLGNLKNDFICWGTRTTENNVEKPIHMQYSIDKKPEYYMSMAVTIEEIENNSEYMKMPGRVKKIQEIKNNNPDEIYYQKNKFYFSHEWYNKLPIGKQQALKKKGFEPYDWREILYQMAHDYYQFSLLGNFYNKLKYYNKASIINSNLIAGNYFFVSQNQFTSNKTGYEQYYLDINSLWRELYDPNLKYDYNLIDKSIDSYKECYIKDEYKLITSINDLKEKAKNYNIYVARMYKDEQKHKIYNFLAPLLDCIRLDVEEKNNQIILKRNLLTLTGGVYIKSDDGMTPVTILNNIKKNELYFKYSYGHNLYEKLDNYLVIEENISKNSYLKLWAEDLVHENSSDIMSISFSLTEAIKNKKLYYKVEKCQDMIDPITYYVKDYFLYKMYCNIPSITDTVKYTQLTQKLKEELSEENINNFKAFTLKQFTNCYKNEIPTYEIKINGKDINLEKTELKEKIDYYNKEELFLSEGNNKYWSKTAVYNPSQLNFWFDFLDSTGTISKYSVSALGNRLKVDNNNKVKVIYYEDVPMVVYHEPEDYKDFNSFMTDGGYNHIWLTDSIKEKMVVSGQGISAKNAIDDLIYNYIHCNETISLTTIPVYYLEPNTRIYVHDPNTQVMGEYIIDKINLSLTYNGTMNITAVKAVQRIN